MVEATKLPREVNGNMRGSPRLLTHLTTKANETAMRLNCPLPRRMKSDVEKLNRNNMTMPILGYMIWSWVIPADSSPTFPASPEPGGWTYRTNVIPKGRPPY